MKYLIILPLFLIGCRASYNIEHINNEFDGYKIDRLYGNYILDDDWSPQNTIQLCPQRFEKNNTANYQIFLEYYGKDWMFIGEGESLVLIIDGKRKSLSGSGSANHRDVLKDDPEYRIKEIAVYEIEKEFLQEIADAKLVKLKLIGLSREAQFQISMKHLINIRKFLQDYDLN